MSKEIKTAEEIMTEVANENSYNTWEEFMYDSHGHTQISATKEVAEKYASQFKHPDTNLNEQNGAEYCDGKYYCSLDKNESVCKQCGKQKNTKPEGDFREALKDILFNYHHDINYGMKQALDAIELLHKQSTQALRGEVERSNRVIDSWKHKYNEQIKEIEQLRAENEALKAASKNLLDKLKKYYPDLFAPTGKGEEG